MRGTFYRRARIVVAVVMAAALLAPAYASAACRHWNLNGKWEFWQSNRAKLVVDLKHDLSTGALTGKAQHSGEVEIGGADIPSTWYGTLDGSLNGNKFRFEVVWEENPDLHGQGEYTGEIGPKGELEGATVDLAHPQNKATWHEWAGRRAKCLPFDPNRDIEVTRPKPFDPAPRAGTDFGGSAPATPAQKTATAKDDVDIWDGAGPPGKPFRCGSINCFLSPSDGPQPVLAQDQQGSPRVWLGRRRSPDGEVMRRPVLQMAVVAGLSVHALAPASAADTCDQWRVPVDWQIYQDNGYRLFFKFDRNQEHGIRGSVEGHHGTNLRGLFEGHINPEKRKIVFTIRWSNGSVGGYERTISRQGIVEGFTYDKNSRGSNAGFRAESMLNCAKWVSTTPSSPAPQSPSGPGSKPDATKNQQGSSTPPDVLTPEKSAGPSPFGDREVTPQKPFDPDPSNVDLTSKPGGIKKAPRAGTNFGGGGGGDPR